MRRSIVVLVAIGFLGATGLLGSSLVSASALSQQSTRAAAASEAGSRPAPRSPTAAAAGKGDRSVSTSRLGTWQPSRHGGAVLLGSGATSPPPCAASQLSAQFWTTFPAMTEDLSGFNVIDTSATACALPAYPSTLGISGASGVVPPVTLDLPGGGQTSEDFVPFGSLAPAQQAAVPGAGLFSAGALALSPGGEAVVVLDETEPISNPPPGVPCLAVPGSGATLDVGLGSGPPLGVEVPSTPLLESTVDPAGSALASCAPVVVSPFLTWAVASAVVGPPTPTSLQGGALPLRDENVYVNAP